jgi:hypothetical protein
VARWECEVPSIGYELESAAAVSRGLSHITAALDAELGEAFRLQHLTQEAQVAGSIGIGRKFTIQAILNGPNGQSALVVSVWFIPSPGAPPHFVTAYPGERQ